MFDPHEVRSRFPIFRQTLSKGRPFVFLDSGASAQKPDVVIDAESDVYRRYYANAYRGVYEFGAKVDEALEASREAVRSLINADSVDEIVFTSGTTMSINLVAHCFSKAFVNSGDVILISEMEHHANIVPWQIAAAERGAKVEFIPVTDDGLLDLDAMDKLLNERVKIIALTGMSNMLGTVNDLGVLSKKAQSVGAKFLVDAAQSVPHTRLDVQALGIDFLAFSGHKLYGPSGIGVLYGRRELLEAMPPFLGGGHMISRVFQDHSEWAHIPAKYEAGTIPIAQAIALKPAIDFTLSLGLDEIAAYEHQLTQYAWDRLHEVPGMKIYGPPVDQRGPILSFRMEGAHPEDIAQLLNRKGVFVRHGHHCTMPLHDRLGIPNSVRASLGVYNLESDIDALVDGLMYVRERLRLTA
jgi:cysteine desulfurase/selenocysteine lyase